MARRRRKSRRRSLSCGCGQVNGLGMETPAGYLTVEGKPRPMLAPAGGSRITGILVKAAIVAAAAGAGWYGWRMWQSRNSSVAPRGLLPGQITPRQMSEAEAEAGGV